MVITYDVFTGKRKLVAHSQLYRLRVDFAQPHFWPWQIGHNRDHSAHFLGNRPDASDDLAVMTEISMRKVQPGDVESSPNQALDHFGRVRCRADGGDNFRLVIAEHRHCLHYSWLLIWHTPSFAFLEQGNTDFGTLVPEGFFSQANLVVNCMN
jgi:hypothetical protein